MDIASEYCAGKARGVGAFFAPFSVLVAGIFAVAMMLPTIVGGQELVIEDGGRGEVGGWGRYFSGTVLGTAAGLLDENNQRSTAGMRLRYARRFDSGFSLVLEGDAYSSNVAVELEREVNRQDGSRVRTETNEVKISNDRAEFREGYLRYSNQYVDVVSGRQLLALGQFDVFSPVDFVLPFDFSSNRIEFSKVALKYSQTANSITLYPTPKLEVQFHQFPRVERDPVLRALFEAQEGFQLPADEEQRLWRILYNGERATFGFTRYEGYGLFAADMAALGADARTELANTLGGTPEQQRRRLNTRDEMPGYPATEGVGFEIAVPRGNYVWKYEVMAVDTHEEFPLCAPFAEGKTLANCRTYYEHLNEAFDGNAWATTDAMYHGLGFDYNSDNWTVNFVMLAFLDRSNADVRRARQLWDRVSDDERDFENVVFPSFHIAKHTEDKRKTTGFGFGLLGVAAGASLYRAWEVNDDLSMGVSLDLLSYISNFQLSADDEEEGQEEEGEDALVESDVVFAPAIRFSFEYSF